MTGLRENEEYGELAYELGKIYWYYYDYGNNEVDKPMTRMTSSVQWFDDAVKYGNPEMDYYQLAMIYRQIGGFYKDITMKVQEAEDHGLYVQFFEDLEELNNYASSESTELIRFEVYKLSFNSLETYAAKIASDNYTRDNNEVTISKNQMTNLYNNLVNNINNTTASSDKTKQMKEDLLKRTDDVEKAIEDAYYQGARGYKG